MTVEQGNLQPVAGVPDIWQRISDAERTLLLLDYDGTLAPFNQDRNNAVPLPGITETLEALHDPPALTIVIVSGRPVQEIKRLLGSDQFTIAGTHGFELSVPGEPITAWELSDYQQRTLETATELALDIASPELVERKIATVAVHTRPLNEYDAARLSDNIERAFRDLVRADEMELRQFDGGYELRATGRHKGMAVTELINHEMPLNLAIYIGDDQTDEDAFRALPTWGIGIKVGHPQRQTAASGRLESCEAVRAFLQDWKRMAQSR